MMQDYKKYLEVTCPVCLAGIGDECRIVNTMNNPTQPPVHRAPHDARRTAYNNQHPTVVYAENGYCVVGDIYMTKELQESQIPVPIGPFRTPDDAEMFMWHMKPFVGHYKIEEITTPFKAAAIAGRHGAADFLNPTRKGRHAHESAEDAPVVSEAPAEV